MNLGKFIVYRSNLFLLLGIFKFFRCIKNILFWVEALLNKINMV